MKTFSPDFRYVEGVTKCVWILAQSLSAKVVLVDGIQCWPFSYAGCVKEVCEAQRNCRGKSSLLIGQQHENKTNHWRNLFHFSQGEKSSLHRPNYTSIQVSCLEKTLKRNSFWRPKFFFVTSIQFIACALRTNLSNRSTGVQMPRDICTRFGRYLHSTKCSWIITTVLSVSTTLFSLALYIERCKYVHF